jgi:glycosyltransferase involved in cell wall biosynthesis
MISIIIPTYNEEKYLGKTLENLKLLTLSHEIIISDDKSTDDTVILARKYTDKVLVPDSKHVTIGANRNAGIKIATGDMVVFMDSSCMVKNPDTFFSLALEHFKNNPKLVGLTGPLAIYPETERWSDRLMYIGFNATTRIKNNFLHMGEAPGKFQMVRKSALNQINGFREDLVTGEDADLFSRLSKIGRTLYDPRLTVYHSGRRAHALGWHRILTTWMIDRLWLTFVGRSKSKDWGRSWEKI